MSDSAPINQRIVEPCAIVGMACRFPGGVRNKHDFWRLLVEGRDGVVKTPQDRWDGAAFYDPDFARSGRISQTDGGYIDGIREFDAGYFGIAPVEAERMDPQQRLFLEVACEALQDAGVPEDSLDGTATGVFVGVATADWSNIQASPENRREIGLHTAIGGSHSGSPGRLGYYLNLKGPSIAIETACSSSLVALHLAVQSLHLAESNLVIVGGINAVLSPDTTMGFSRGGFLSPTGRCKPFDASADGYVRAEGVGVVLIKRLSDAQRAGDRIYAVIEGSAVNQDGHTAGITAPSVDSQVAAYRAACRMAGRSGGEISYVEAHGTGTVVGDAAELRSLGQFYGGPQRQAPCVVGSVKSNIGHLEAAAGMAGLIKLCLMMQHRKIPRTLHFERPSDGVDLQARGLRVSTSTEEWPGGTLVGAVNSFGFTGTNAHVVLRSPDVVLDRSPEPEDGRERLVVLSAKSRSALEQYAEVYEQFVRGAAAPRFSQLAAHSLARSSHQEHRLAIVARDASDLAQRLGEFRGGLESDSVRSRKREKGPHKVMFVYSGQGCQWWRMGAGLLAESAVFRDAVAEIDRAFIRLSGWSLLDELAKDEGASRIDDTRVAQPAIFAVQVGLTRVLEAQGLVPDGVVGHSVGEVAAAHVSGALSFDDAIRVIYERSRLQAQAAGLGSMLATGLDTEQAETLIAGLAGRVSIAAYNAPRGIVLAGDAGPLRDIAAALDRENVFNRPVRVTVPFHSHYMEPLRDELERALAGISPGHPRCGLFSTVTGEPVETLRFDGPYWYRNVREPVRMVQAITAALRHDYNIFLEIGSHPILSRDLALTVGDEAPGVRVHPTLSRNKPDRQALAELWARLYVQGVAFSVGSVAEVVDVPARPWNHHAYWCTTREFDDIAFRRPAHPLVVGHSALEREKLTRVWDFALDPRTDPFIAEHVLQQAIVYPGAGHVDMALFAAQQDFGDAFRYLEQIEFLSPIIVPEHAREPVQVRMEIYSESGEYFIYARTSPTQGGYRLASRGRINHREGRLALPPRNLHSLLAECSETVSPEFILARTEQAGLVLGETFQGARSLWRGPRGMLGEIEVPGALTAEYGGYAFHPAILDTVFRVCFAGIFEESRPEVDRGIYIPVRIRACRQYAPPTRRMYAYSEIKSLDDQFLVADLWIFNEDGELSAEISDFRCQYLKGSRRESDTARTDCLYQFKWLGKPTVRAGLPKTSPSCLPSPSVCAPDFARHARAFVADPLRAATFEDMIPAAQRLCAAYVLEAFARLGYPLRGGMHLTPEEAVGRLGVVSRHQSYFIQLLRWLERQGILEGANLGYRVRRLETESAEGLAEAGLRELGDFHEELGLMAAVGPVLSEVLTGRIDPVKVLFPDDGKTRLNGFYERAPVFSVYYRLLRGCLGELLGRAGTGRPIRILEVGAGTGGLTKAILPLLDPRLTSYVFTDVSASFLRDARERLRDYPFVEYATFDLEKDPLEQGFVASRFDLVVASAAIHATRDLRESLRHIKRLLRPGGSLLFIEPTAESAFGDFIFGITDGWWRFRDVDLRPRHPLIDDRQWVALLREEGFSDVHACSDRTELHTPAQSVLVGRKPPEAAEDNDSRASAGAVVVFADDRGVAARLRASLESSGQRVVEVLPRPGPGPAGHAAVHIDRLRYEDYQRLAHEVLERHRTIDCIVYAWGIRDARAGEAPSALVATQDDACLPLLRLARLATQESIKIPRIVVVTSGAQAVGPSDRVDLGQAPLIGLTRVMRNELSETNVQLVDLSRHAHDIETDLLADEVISPGDDEEVAIRDGQRHITRYIRLTAEDLASTLVQPRSGRDFPYRLEVKDYGVLESLHLAQYSLPTLGPGDVRIRVKATALNFRDVMVAMGLVTDEAVGSTLTGRTLGCECAGVVEAVGADVTGVAVGDEVMALARHGFSSFLTVGREHVFPKPPAMSFAQAAAMPLVTGTAYYALNLVARLRKGDTVLIHAGAGGVGIAAILLAQRAGAEVIATAGSDRKRDFVRSLGVKHVFDSRSLGFHEDVMAVTNGRGVDVVLNSLSGKALYQSAQCLAPFGHFIELGKVDIYANSKLGMRLFGENRSFTGVSYDQVYTDKVDLTREIIRELGQLYSEGVFAELPVTTYPLAQYKEAFRSFSTAKHIGKVVLTVEDEPVLVTLTEDVAFAANGAYLVTGGAGGVGLEAARWLAQHGARHLVLMSRSGVRDDHGKATVQELVARGVTVEVVLADVTDREAVARTVRAIHDSGHRLRGVIHAAMVLHDTPLKEMSDEQFSAAARPKILGAYNLHLETREEPLEFFLLYSSFTAVIGTIGQANYSAGNTFLEALAHERSAVGLPATCIHWGAFGEAGFVARSERHQRQLAHQGLLSMRIDEAHALLQKLLARRPVAWGASKIDWAQLGKVYPRAAAAQKTRELVLQAQHRDGSETSSERLRHRLLKLAPEKGMAVLMRELGGFIARVIGVEAHALDTQVPTTQLGIESLMATQITAYIKEHLDVDYPMMKLMRGLSIAEIGAELLQMIPASSGGHAAASAEAGRLVVRFRPAMLPRMRLFTISHLGGEAAEFEAWLPHLGDEIELCALELPGWGTRRNEPPFNQMEELVHYLGEQLKPLLDVPFALFGHSLGGLMAFELAHHLEATHGAVASQLLIGSNLPPHLFNTTSMPDLKLIEENVGLESIEKRRQQLLTLGLSKRLLSSDLFFRSILPSADAYFDLMTAYVGDVRPPVSSPLTVFIGDRDHLMNQAQLVQWQRYTTEAFECVVVEGGHLFNLESPPELARRVMARLMAARATTRASAGRERADR